MGAERIEAKFALLRELGSPDPADPGEPEDAPDPEGTVVFEDDFSDEASGWTIGAFPTGTIGYRDGQYVIELADVPAATQGSNTVLEGDKRDPKVESLDSVSISATVTKIQQVGGNMGFDHPISRRLDHAEVRPERRLLVTIVDSTVGLCCNSVAFDDIEIRDLS